MHTAYDGIRDVWPCISWGAWLTEKPGIPLMDSSHPGSGAIDHFVSSSATSLALAVWPFHSFHVGTNRILQGHKELLVPAVEIPMENLQSGYEGTSIDLSVAGIASVSKAMNASSSVFGHTADDILGRFVITVGDSAPFPLPVRPTFDRTFYSLQVGRLDPPAQGSAPLNLRVELETAPNSSMMASLVVGPDGQYPAKGRSPQFRSLPPPPMLCHVQIRQYRTAEAAFRASTREAEHRNVIGAFPVFNKESKLIGYRPTDEGCLMRSMTVRCFCPICLERIWRRVLSRTGLLRTNSANLALLSDSLVVKASPKLNIEVLSQSTKDNLRRMKRIVMTVRPAPINDIVSSKSYSSIDIIWEALQLYRDTSNKLEVKVEELTQLRGKRKVNLPLFDDSDVSQEREIRQQCWRVRAVLTSTYLRCEPKIFETTAFAFVAQENNRPDVNKELDTLGVLQEACISPAEAEIGLWKDSLEVDGFNNGTMPITVNNAEPFLLRRRKLFQDGFLSSSRGILLFVLAVLSSLGVAILLGIGAFRKKLRVL